MFYTTTSDPSDSWSNHWSNGEKATCPTCESEDIEYSHTDTKYFREYYSCKKCGDEFSILN
jgi:transcription elongation factor Elf1